METIRVMASLDFRLHDLKNNYVPFLQRNVIARAGDGIDLVLSESTPVDSIKTMVEAEAFMDCYAAGVVQVVDEAVAGCQTIIVEAAQRHFKLLQRDVSSLVSFLRGLGHGCQTPPRVGFTDETNSARPLVIIESANDIDGLRSGAFSEASVRNWIDMIVSAAQDNDRG